MGAPVYITHLLNLVSAFSHTVLVDADRVNPEYTIHVLAPNISEDGK